MSKRYRGVRQHKHGLFNARLVSEGVERHLGCWLTAHEAAVAYDRAAVYYFGTEAQLNFSVGARDIKPTDADTLSAEARALTAERMTSRHRGVSWHPHPPQRPWCASLKSEGRRCSLTRWETERDAAIAYDRAALYYFGEDAELNFPRQSRARGPANNDQLNEESWTQFKTRTSSQYRGVSWEPRGWVAYVNHKYRRTNLGRYAVEEDAARAYDVAAKKLHGSKAKLNLPES